MTATLNDRTVLVANHRRLAPADDVLDTLDDLGATTANEIGEHLDVCTRDVVATLNVLSGPPTPLVVRSVTEPPGGEQTRAARWRLA